MAARLRARLVLAVAVLEQKAELLALERQIQAVAVAAKVTMRARQATAALA